jgi:hypothetical protein
VPEALRCSPFLGSAAVSSGLLTRRQLGGNTWRRLFQDVYVHRSVPVTHVLRAQAAVLLQPAAVVTGCSAAVLWGVPLAEEDDDVEITLPPAAHMVRVAGVVARRAALDPAQLTTHDGLRLTTPAATALRLAAALSHDAAVIAVDRLIATGLVEIASIRALAARMRGPGSARARAVAADADGLAESPQETRLRLLMARSSLPPPVAQYRIEHEGRFVARVDFAWPELKVAVEYDGLWHAESRQFAKDRERLNRLQAAGWRVVFVTAADLHRPEQLLARIAAALSA